MLIISCVGLVKERSLFAREYFCRCSMALGDLGTVSTVDSRIWLPQITILQAVGEMFEYR